MSGGAFWWICRQAEAQGYMNGRNENAGQVRSLKVKVRPGKAEGSQVRVAVTGK